MRALACIVAAILAAHVGLGVQRAVYDCVDRWLSRVPTTVGSAPAAPRTWREDCNTCTYLGNGVASCTLLACDVTPALTYGGTAP